MARWTAFLLVALAPVVARAQLGGGALPDLSGVAGAIGAAARSTPPAPTTGLFRSGLAVPRVRPGEASTAVARQLRVAVEAEAGPQPALELLEAQMPALLAAVEDAIEQEGFAARDFGVAVAVAFVELWEAARGEAIPDDASDAAARTVAGATATAWAGPYGRLAPADQEWAYETLLASAALLSALAQQFDEVGMADEARQMREGAAQTFEALFGTPPSQVSVDAQGRVSGLADDAALPTPTPNAAPPVATGPPLPPARIGGAEVYVKYRWSYGIQFQTFFDPLVLFPDGTAVQDTPDAPVAEFTPAALRAAFDPDDRAQAVGTWRRDGDRLTLTFGGETRVLPQVPDGWWDGEGDYEPEAAYDVYFPAIIATADQIVGPWKASSLVTVGMAGGGDVPMVSSGSSRDRVFYGDGTFSSAFQSFAGAMGGSAGLGIYSENHGDSVGRWRLDGPLLTVEEDGQRRVLLAFLLPHWEDGLFLLGRNWERPESD